MLDWIRHASLVPFLSQVFLHGVQIPHSRFHAYGFIKIYFRTASSVPSDFITKMRHSSGEFKLVVEQYAIAAPLLAGLCLTSSSRVAERATRTARHNN